MNIRDQQRVGLVATTNISIRARRSGRPSPAKRQATVERARRGITRHIYKHGHTNDAMSRNRLQKLGGPLE